MKTEIASKDIFVISNSDGAYLARSPEFRYYFTDDVFEAEHEHDKAEAQEHIDRVISENKLENQTLAINHWTNQIVLRGDSDEQSKVS